MSVSLYNKVTCKANDFFSKILLFHTFKQKVTSAHIGRVLPVFTYKSFWLQSVALEVRCKTITKVILNRGLANRICQHDFNPKDTKEFGSAFGMLKAGASATAHVGASEQAARSLRRRFAQTGTTDDLLQNDRRHVTRTENRYSLNQHLRNRPLTPTETALLLAANVFYARRPYVKHRYRYPCFRTYFVTQGVLWIIENIWPKEWKSGIISHKLISTNLFCQCDDAV